MAIPGVDEAATAARAAVDALLRHRILRRRSAEVTAEASLRAARASAALDGHDVPLDALRARLGETGHADDRPAGHQPVDPRERSLAVTLGAVRLYAELGTLSSAWERAPRQALARMHVLAGRGLLPDDVLGRPRNDGSPPMPGVAGIDLPSGPVGAGTSDAAGFPGVPAVAAAEMSQRLDGLTAVLTVPTRAPAIVVAAITHGELLSIRPFGALDGIIARAAARLVLVSRGLDPKALVATDVGHLELDRDRTGSAGTAGPVTGVRTTEAEPDYRAALAAYAAGGAEGVGVWVRHCARAMELAARESLAVCEALSRA